VTDAHRCPACRAPWRGVAICPRCGADLTPLMRLAVRAWALREAARAALLAGDDADALALAQAAYALAQTPRAQCVLALALVATGDPVGARAVLTEAAATQ
jgi:predicted amidophosphoribosyltransferase